MDRHPLRAIATAALVAVAVVAEPVRAVDLGWTALAGWQGGAVLRVTASATHVVPRIPLAFDLGIGHAFIDPGDAALARRVFINENTNGTPEKSGGVWDLRLDGVWGLKLGPLQDFGVFGGLRYSMYSGRFTYVGGNEDFVVTSNAWGIGVGARGSLPINAHFSLSASVGLDWFPTQTLEGHDASYSSNNVNNGRGTYTWADADRAINQPWLLPSLLVGVTWRP